MIGYHVGTRQVGQRLPGVVLGVVPNPTDAVKDIADFGVWMPLVVVCLMRRYTVDEKFVAFEANFSLALVVLCNSNVRSLLIGKKES